MQELESENCVSRGDRFLAGEQLAVLELGRMASGLDEWLLR